MLVETKEKKMKQKRQRLMNRCNLQNETHIFFIEDYKISNFGMIKGYHLLRVISKENFNKFNQTDRKQSTFNDMCDVIKVNRTFLFGLTDWIKTNYEGFEDVEPLRFPDLVNALIERNIKEGQFKPSKWHEFVEFPQEKK